MGDIMTGGGADPIAERLNLLDKAGTMSPYIGFADEQVRTLLGERGKIDQRLAEVNDSRAGLQTTIDEARAEAYAWIVANDGEVPAGRLCWLAARAAFLDRQLGEPALERLHDRAQALGQLGAGDAIITLSGPTASGLVARSPLGFARHSSGLSITFEAAPSGSDAVTTVTSSIDDLFGRPGTTKANSGRNVFVGGEAIREAVSGVLAQPGEPNRPSATSLVLALRRAGLTLNKLGIEPSLIEAARDQIYRVATEPRAYRHHVQPDKRQGHTDVVDAEAWAAAFLVDRPLEGDEATMTEYTTSVADELERLAIERLRQAGYPSNDRIKTIARRLVEARGDESGITTQAQVARLEAKVEDPSAS